jgi:hypothetical protein
MAVFLRVEWGDCDRTALPGEVTLGIARGRTWKITQIFQVLPLTLPLVYTVAAAGETLHKL